MCLFLQLSCFVFVLLSAPGGTDPTMKEQMEQLVRFKVNCSGSEVWMYRTQGKTPCLCHRETPGGLFQRGRWLCRRRLPHRVRSPVYMSVWVSGCVNTQGSYCEEWSRRSRSEVSCWIWVCRRSYLEVCLFFLLH